MAVIKRLRAYLRDALDAARDLIAYGVVRIEHTHEAVIDDVAGIVFDHAYLLPDDTLLLGNGLVGEIGRRDKFYEHTQVFLKALGAAEIIGGHAA